MRVLGIVPARAGSKRLPGKNLQLLGGKTLVARAIDTALGASTVSAVAVSSDDPRVLAIARASGAIALERPSELATDTSPAVDYVRHAFDVLEAEGGARFDAVAIVQPTSPFTSTADVDATVRLLETTGADSAASVMELDHAIHPFKLKRMDEEGRLLAYLQEEGGRMAAHEIPRLYVRNGSVYVTRRDVIEAGQIIGADCRGYVMPRTRSVDINDELDLRFAEFLCASST